MRSNNTKHWLCSERDSGSEKGLEHSGDLESGLGNGMGQYGEQEAQGRPAAPERRL